MQNSTGAKPNHKRIIPPTHFNRVIYTTQVSCVAVVAKEWEEGATKTISINRSKKTKQNKSKKHDNKNDTIGNENTKTTTKNSKNSAYTTT